VVAERTGGDRTAVIGERELAIGFRLIGIKDVLEATPATAADEFQKIMARDEFSLVVASEGVRRALSENQRLQAESSLHPLVVFVPSPTGEYEVESLAALAKRVLGVSLKV
jgi:V/A-type H+-transporting ATPase subunit F